MEDITTQLASLIGSPMQKMGGMGAPGAQNGLLPQQGGGDAMPGLYDLIRRKTAFRGMDMGMLLQMLNDLINGDGGGNGGGGNGGGNGGGAGCLTSDVLVRMADGSEECASDIRVDDQILGLDPELGLTPQTVTCTNSSRQMCYRVKVVGLPDIEASSSHRWFTERGLVLTPDLQVGDNLVGEEGGFVGVREVLKLGSKVVHWWNCDPNHCYFAGGVLHHNITPDTFKGHGWNSQPWPNSMNQSTPGGTGPGEG